MKREEGRRGRRRTRGQSRSYTRANSRPPRPHATPLLLSASLVQVYGEDGTFLRSHGGFGIEEGKFHFPCGIAVDQVRGQEKQLESVPPWSNHHVDKNLSFLCMCILHLSRNGFWPPTALIIECRCACSILGYLHVGVRRAVGCNCSISTYVRKKDLCCIPCGEFEE